MQTINHDIPVEYLTIPLLSPDIRMLEGMSNCNEVIGLPPDVLSSFCIVTEETTY
jgi:hypothetical protein